MNQNNTNTIYIIIAIIIFICVCCFLSSSSYAIYGYLNPSKPIIQSSVPQTTVFNAQATSPMVASLQQSNYPQTVPSSVPQTIPSNVPQSVPSTVPQSVPSSVPQSVPSSVPQSVPSSVPQSVPSSVPQSVPSSVPQSVPSSVPQSVPSSVPQSVPSSVPQSVPSTTTPSTPQFEPTRPQLVPQTVPIPEPLSGTEMYINGLQGLCISPKNYYGEFKFIGIDFCNNTDSQQWRYDENTKQIKNFKDGQIKCIDSSEPVPTLSQCDPTNNNQKFDRNIDNTQYGFKNISNGQCLDMYNPGIGIARIPTGYEFLAPVGLFSSLNNNPLIYNQCNPNYFTTQQLSIK